LFKIKNLREMERGRTFPSLTKGNLEYVQMPFCKHPACRGAKLILPLIRGGLRRGQIHDSFYLNTGPKLTLTLSWLCLFLLLFGQQKDEPVVFPSLYGKHDLLFIFHLV
jgi:hypothetical protein